MSHNASWIVQAAQGRQADILGEYERRGYPVQRVDSLRGASRLFQQDIFTVWLPSAVRDVDLHVAGVIGVEGGLSMLYNVNTPGPRFNGPEALGLPFPRFVPPSLPPLPNWGPLALWQPLGPDYLAALALQRLPLAQRSRYGFNTIADAQTRIHDLLFPSGEAISPLGPLGLGAVVNAPRAASLAKLEPILDAIGATEAWRENQGEGATVAILDTGVDPSVIPDSLKAGGFASTPDGNPWRDDVGHGSMCAAIVHAVAPKAKIYSVRPSPDDDGHLSAGEIYLAGDHLIGKVLDGAGPFILNNSWGIPGCLSSFIPADIIGLRALTRLDEMNLMLSSWAAGNYHAQCGDDSISMYGSASSAFALAVGAVGEDLRPQPYSSRGPGVVFPMQPAVCCPTYGTLPWGSGFRDFGQQGGGTSSCAPQVSGALAILQTAYPKASNRLLRAAIRAGADNGKVGQSGVLYSVYTGFGLLQVDRSLRRMPLANTHPSFALEAAWPTWR